MLLREMKDLKRSYREAYDRLKQVKGAINDAQQNVDAMKQQIVVDFERWYSQEFEAAMPGESTALLSYTAGPTEETPDDEADTYLRAKRNVDTLHRARVLEKQRPAGFKK